MPNNPNLNIENLKTAYRNKRLVPFIGAGLSFPFKMPGWGTLIDDICDMYDYEELIKKREQIKNLIGEYKFLDAVDLMVGTGVPEEDIKSAISLSIHKQKSENKENEPDSIYKDLARMNCTKYLTTNYDNYLSDYVGNGPSDIRHLYDEYINEIDNKHYESMVYNLHGDYKKSSTIVLSRSSYNTLYNDSAEFKAILENFRERYTFLFIGVSFDDEYLRKVLEVIKGKLRAKHYLLSHNISHEKRVELERKYDIRVIKYPVINGNHTEGIRQVLSEIIHVDLKDESNSVFLNSNQHQNEAGLSFSKIKDETSLKKSPLMDETIPAIIKESKVYKEVQAIKTLQDRGELEKAATEYNKIFQRSIYEPISEPEKNIVIKGMLYNYTLLRDYKAADALINISMNLPHSKENIDLLSYIVDFYFNQEEFESAYNVAVRWYEDCPDEPMILGLKLYTETVFKNIPIKKAISQLVDSNGELIFDDLEKQEIQFIYRLIGELGIWFKDYSLAIRYLQKAYEIKDNIFNLEDLGIAYYFKSLENADDGIKISISNIDFGILNKAVEFFEHALVRAKGSIKIGVKSRIAIPYLRSLFYLKKTVKFIESYDELIEYCQKDNYEISRMKAIIDIQLDNLGSKELENLNKVDKALILGEYYASKKLYDKALSHIKPIAEETFDENENVIIQLLLIYFHASDRDNFNKNYEKYLQKWPKSQHQTLLQIYHLEINGNVEDAESNILDIIKFKPTTANYALLVGFYYRIGQISKIGKLYEEVLEEQPDVVAQEPESFYFVYHEYLMQMNNLEKAYELFKKASKDIGNGDVIKFMEVEIKIRLFDFTGVAENSIQIFEKYHEYGESIFSYYAAVAYMHYLELEKARQYLDIYKANGRVDQRSLELVNRVESRLDILQGHRKINPTGQPHQIGVHAYNSFKNSKSLQLPKDQQVIIDAPSLYIIFKEGLLEALEDCKKIILTFTTIDQLQKDYCDTGDEVLQKIIQYLGENEKIEIVSPSIESILKRGSRALEKFQDYYDSLSLAIEIDVLFISSYHLPLNQVNGRPVYLPLCFKVIRIENGEIQIHGDPISN